MSLKVAVLGCGVVGTEVVRQLTVHAAELQARAGVQLELIGIAVRNLDAVRDAVIDRSLLTTDAHALVEQADLVIELLGGLEPARELILKAFAGGASVVTANKALLADSGPSLYEAAAAAGVDLYFEAAVAGAIPVVRVVREALLGDQVTRVLGIVNGTTNYVLDSMTTTGADLDVAVAQAQKLGYAEADPTADVEGFDAAAKAAILASLAFHSRVSLADVDREGITGLTAQDMAWAERTGHVLKLLAVAERLDGGISVRVHPALVPADHPLAGVRGAFNAVFIETAAAGELMLYGKGAGGRPTASAVLGDVVSVAANRVKGTTGPTELVYAGLPVLPAQMARSRFQIRMDVADKLGVLAQISQVLADLQVSIESVRQLPGATGVAHLVITTHAAAESSRRAAVAALGELDVVDGVVSVLRVEGA